MGIFEDSFVCFIFTALEQERNLETVTNLNASKGMFQFLCSAQKEMMIVIRDIATRGVFKVSQFLSVCHVLIFQFMI